MTPLPLPPAPEAVCPGDVFGAFAAEPPLAPCLGPVKLLPVTCEAGRLGAVDAG